MVKSQILINFIWIFTIFLINLDTNFNGALSFLSFEINDIKYFCI
jgi:hypothetical protein